jgi:hypothetical protein
MNTEQTTETKKEVFFDESGQTVEEVEVSDQTEDTESTEEPSETPHKYRIGDKTFATQEEALAYAQSQVNALETETQLADAYRQGLKDALKQPAPTEIVTQPQDEFDTEELYTNPKSFLDKFASKIKTETRSELEQKEALRSESDQIWREFTERHPSLADFRGEVENFVNQNLTEVRAVIGTKGRPAGYDYVATKLKSRFEAYASALRPKRELSNGGGGASPTQKAASVTPKKEEKKALSFAEQIRSIRKRR